MSSQTYIIGKKLLFKPKSMPRSSAHYSEAYENVVLWGTIYQSGINAAFYAKLRHLYKASKIVNFSLTSLPRSECGVESDPDA